jgi:hypothetical protein
MNDILASEGTISEMIGTLRHLRAEVERLRQVLENVQHARILQGKAITDASNEIDRLRAEVSELNSMFDARWSADMRAIECWRKENPGNELVLPDHVDLSLWLMEERTRLTAEIEMLRAALWDVHALANNGPLVWSKRIKATARAALGGDDE